MSKHTKKTDNSIKTSSLSGITSDKSTADIFIFDKCSVSLSFSPKETDKIIESVKEILLTSYRLRMSAS